ncbi:MAG: hypothetical protein AAF564_05570 [Bacteroidota bacterium]
MRNALRYLLIGVVLLLILVPAFLLGPYFLRVEQFTANPAKGYHADFFLYVSPQAKSLAKAGKPLTILVQPNNSGINSDDAEVHVKDARWMGFGRHFLANELGVALLVPAFVRPGEDWHIYTHALDRDVLTTSRADLGRLDLQLIAMIDAARAHLESKGLESRPRVLLQGYSASGMFANRFTALHPDRVMAVAAGSPGGWPIAPVASSDGTSLPYPIGVADLATLTGAAFDSTAYARVPQLIVMGGEDENDSVDYTDGWDTPHAALVDSLFEADPVARWPHAMTLYNAAGTNARFTLVPGIGHDRRALQPYSTAFFEEVLGGL